MTRCAWTVHASVCLLCQALLRGREISVIEHRTFIHSFSVLRQKHFKTANSCRTGLLIHRLREGKPSGTVCEQAMSLLCGTARSTQRGCPHGQHKPSRTIEEQWAGVAANCHPFRARHSIHSGCCPYDLLVFRKPIRWPLERARMPPDWRGHPSHSPASSTCLEETWPAESQ